MNPPQKGNGSNVLLAVSLVSINSVWAVGSSTNGDAGGCGMLPTNPEVSQKVNQPYGQYCSLSPLGCTLILPPAVGVGYNNIYGMAVLSDGNVWAVGKQTGSSGSSSGLVLHWNGSSLDDINGDKWDVVPTSNLDATSNRFYAVAAPPSTNASRAITHTWAVGSAYNGQYSLVENIKAPDAPTSTTTTSFYESSISPTLAYTQGKEAALQHKTGIFVLDYGRPKNWGTTSNPITGTELIDAPSGLRQATIAQIQESAKGFLKGYDENASPRPSDNSVYVVIATNNYSKTTNLVYDPAELTNGHGREWGIMVNNVQSYANSQGYSEMKVVAGIDAEPNWSDYSKVYDWIKGYSSITTAGYYNFGSLDGYPCVDGISFPLPASIKGNNDGCPRVGWRMQQFFELSWELRGAHPLPEIYDPLWAREWYLIKRWGIDNKPSFPAMRFDGLMTDCKPGDICSVSEFNSRPALTTNQGWQSMWLELNSEISTTQALPWSTTITHTVTSP